MKKDLVTQTAEYLEVSLLMIFAISKLYANKSVKRPEAEHELNQWRKTGKYGVEVEDFCLDILSKRIGFDTIIGEQDKRKVLK